MHARHLLLLQEYWGGCPNALVSNLILQDTDFNFYFIIAQTYVNFVSLGMTSRSYCVLKVFAFVFHNTHLIFLKSQTQQLKINLTGHLVMWLQIF